MRTLKICIITLIVTLSNYANVWAQLVGGTIADYQTICYNTGAAAFTSTVPASLGTEPYAYTWQLSTTSSIAGIGSWTDIGTGLEFDYSATNLTTTTYYFVRKVVDATPATEYSNVITVTVHPSFVAGTIGADQTICNGATPTGLTGTVPTGGDGTYTYNWQYYNGTSWVNALGTRDGQNYSPGALTDITRYRRQDISGSSCGTQITNEVTITVRAVFTAGTISADQTICNGATPTQLDGTLPTGGNTPYTYNWQQSIDEGLTWGNAIGTRTTQNYIPGVLTTTTKYRRQDISASSCGTQPTNEVTVTVRLALTAGTIGSNQSICTGSAPAGLTGSLPTGGDETYTYNWQQYTSSWGDAAGTRDQQNYSPGTLTTLTNYRRQVTSGSSCGTQTSNEVTITVYPVLTAGTISSAQNICYNTIPTGLTGTGPSGGGGSYTYNWQQYTTSWGDASGTRDGQNYSPGSLTETTIFRRQVSSAIATGCGTLTSNEITITVRAVFIAGTISADQTICNGATPAGLTGTVPTGGNTPYTYNWQYYNGTSWVNALGTRDGQNYSPGALTTTTKYRRQDISASSCGTQPTNEVTVTVRLALTPGTISSSQSICTGSAPAGLTGSLPTGGDETYTYNWQQYTSSWGDAAGTRDQQNYSPGTLTTLTKYRRQVTSGSSCGTQTSNEVTITVNAALTAGSISSDQSICNGTTPATLNGTASTGGGGTYTYNWQQSTDGGTIWTDALGTRDGEDYSPSALIETTKYQRQVSSAVATGCGTLTTNVVTIIVHPDFTVGSIGTDQTICYNATPAQLNGTLPTGGDGTYTYNWQKSTDDGLTWGNASGTRNGQNYSPPALTTTTKFRRQDISGSSCGSLISNVVTITVYLDLTSGAIGNAQTICNGITPAPLVETTPASGATGSYTYKWQSCSTFNGTYTDITPAATDIGYSPGPIFSTIYYKRLVTSGSCGSKLSAYVKITAHDFLTSGTIGDAQTICYNTTPLALTEKTAPTGGTGTYTYQWQSSLNNLTWGNIDLAENSSYSPPALITSTYYRRNLIDADCGTIPSASILITVRPILAGGSIGSDQTICNGIDVAPFTGVPVASGGSNSFTYSWQYTTTLGAVPGDASWTTDPTNATTYDFGTLTASTKFIRKAVDAVCNTPVYSNEVNITVRPAISLSITPASPTTCVDTWITLTAAPSGGSGTFSNPIWSDVGAASLNATNIYSPSLKNATSGTYPLTFTVTDGYSCNKSASTSVVITPAAVGGSIAGSTAVCSGTNSTLLTLSGYTGTIVRWESSVDNWANSSIISNTNTTYTATNLTATTKYKAYIQNGTCSSLYSSEATVTVNQNPTATISPTVPEVCAGLNLNLTATPAGGSGTYTTHLWSGAGAAFITAGGSSATPTFNHNVAGSYTLTYTVTDNNTCQGSASTTVVVNSLPTINSIGSNTPVCVGNALNLTSAADRPVSFSWSGPSAYGNTIQSPLVSSNTQLIMAGTYNLTVTDGKGCVKSGSTVVVVNALPVVNIGGNVEICANSTLNLTESGGEATSWSWTGPNSYTSSAQNPSISNISAPYAGTYNITINNANCSNTASKVVVVNPLPTATISPSSPSVCAGTGLVLTAIPSGGSGTYSTHLWTDASSSSTPTNAISTTFTNSSQGNYPISYTVTDSKTCQVVANTSVAVNPISVGGTIAGSASVCSGINSKTLTLSGYAGSIVRWESSIDNFTTHSIINNTTTTNVATNLTQTTKYRALIQNGGCTSVYSSDATITVNSNPTATISPLSPEVCAGLNLNLTATPAGGSGTYSTHAWTGTGASSLTATNIANPDFTNGSSGSYTLTYTVTDNNTCVGSASASVVVNSNPTITIGNNSPVCVGKLLSISGGSDRTVAYSWSGPASYSSSIQSPIVSTAATVAMNGVYSLTVTDSKGCVNNTTTNVTVNALPVFTVSNNGPICKGTPLILTGPSSMISYAWVGPNDYVNSTQSPTVSATALTTMSGDYTLTATDNNGCVNSFTTNATVKPLPTVTAASNGPLCAGFALNLTGTTNGSTYSWSGPLTYTSTTLSPTVSTNATTAMSGTYTLTSTLNGCTDIATTSVTVNSLPVIEFTAPTLTFNRKDPGVNLAIYLKPGSTGGTFTGEGVGTNGYFYPTLVGQESSVVTKTITYTLTNSNNCTSVGTIDIMVTGDLAYFDGFVPTYHYCKNSSATPFTITVTGYGTTSGESFSVSTPNGWTLDPIDKYKITFDPKLMDPGQHTLSFTYTENSNTYTIQSAFTIEFVQVTSTFIDVLQNKYCKSDPEVVLVVAEYSPLGGTGHFSGPIADLTKASNTVTFRPTDMPLNQEITISYYYTTAKGCNSPVISKQTRVNSLPVLNFTLKDNYNYDENPVLLVGDPVGGGFSSPDNVIINSTTLDPSLTTNYNTSNPISITYSYTDANQCSSTLTKTTKVYQADKSNNAISNLSSTFCYEDKVIDISCNPNVIGNAIPFTGTFSSKKLAITQINGNEAKYSLTNAGSGLDTVRFNYSINGTPYQIVKPVFIDYFDNIRFINLDDKYCKNVESFTFNGTQNHFGGDGTGTSKYLYNGSPSVFTNLITSANYIPKNENVGVYTFTYIYKSTYYNSGCTDTITKQVSINAMPEAKFVLAEPCPGTTKDVYFVNKSTISSGTIDTCIWTFEGNKIKEFEPHYRYQTTGDKPISLQVISDKSCFNTYSEPITIGVAAKADFTWNSECLDGEEITFKNTSDGVNENKIKTSKWIYKGDTIFWTLDMNYIFPELGKHKMKLDILTKDGCKDTITKQILIQPYIKLQQLPNLTYYQNFDTINSYFNWQTKGISDAYSSRWNLGTPDGDSIHTASSGINSWFTKLTDKKDVENSQVVSPCFDLTGLKGPMIKLNIWSSSEPKRDGAILQYSLDKGVTWAKLGTKGEGIEWFNSDGILSNPGQQPTTQETEGWSQVPMTNWTDVRHNLDTLMKLNNTNVRFRIAYASDGNGTGKVDGFAFDDVWIGERQRMVLGEYFTNSLVTACVASNQYLSSFEAKNSLDIIPIHYHTASPIGDPLYNDYTSGPSSRVFYYGISQVPFVYSNGVSSSTLINADSKLEFERLVDVETLQDPKISISLNVTTSNVGVTLTANKDLTMDNLVLYCAVVKDSIQAGGVYYYNVLRKFIPNPGGISISTAGLTSGQTLSESIPVNIDNSAEFIGARLVVFVQNSVTNQVYQSATFKTSDITGIKPNNTSNLVDVYPNPTSDYLIIESEYAINRLVVFDISGREVYNLIPAGTRYSLPVQNLENGIYILKGSTKKGEFIKKFIKQ